MKTLPEVAVADADAATRVIYESIMKHSGTGTPALIFRHFAVFPGLLDWVWSAIGDEVKSGRALRTAMDAVARTPTVKIPAIGEDDLLAAGVGPPQSHLLRAILANYSRMNPMNFSLITAVRNLVAVPKTELQGPIQPHGKPLPERTISKAPIAPLPPLPAPVDLRDMPEDLRQIVLSLSQAIPSTGSPVIPTLYRHLAIWPDLMRLLAPGITASVENGDVAARMVDLGAEMATLTDAIMERTRGEDLGPPPIEDRDTLVGTLDTFLVAIPHMIVIGDGLDRAMPGSIHRWHM